MSVNTEKIMSLNCSIKYQLLTLNQKKMLKNKNLQKEEGSLL